MEILRSQYREDENVLQRSTVAMVSARMSQVERRVGLCRGLQVDVHSWVRC